MKLKDHRTVREIAEEFGILEETVRQWIRSSKLRAVKFGKQYWIKEEWFVDFLGKYGIEITNDP